MCDLYNAYLSVVLPSFQVLWKTLYPLYYTSDVQTRVSNALLVGQYIIFFTFHVYWMISWILGEVLGQVAVGLICDRIGRKIALVATTTMIIVGAIIGTAANGVNGDPNGLFWCLTVARGIIGVVSIWMFAIIHEFLFLTINVFRVLEENTLLLLLAPAKRPMRRY